MNHSVLLENIPLEIRQLDQWVLWRNVERGGRSTKVPYRSNGVEAKCNDASTWSAFETVRDALLSCSDWAGIGFVFSSTDDYYGVDLDGCRDSHTGQLTSWASYVLRAIPNAYCEVSPSGWGVKLIARGRPPISSGKTGEVFKAHHLDLTPIAGSPKAPEIALFVERRFFCLTGELLEVPAC